MEKFQPNIDLYPSSSVWNGCGSCPFCLNIKNSQFIFYEETKNIFFRNSKINFFLYSIFHLFPRFLLSSLTTQRNNFYHKNFEIKIDLKFKWFFFICLYLNIHFLLISGYLWILIKRHTFILHRIFILTNFLFPHQRKIKFFPLEIPKKSNASVHFNFLQ